MLSDINNKIRCGGFIVNVQLLISAGSTTVSQQMNVVDTQDRIPGIEESIQSDLKIQPTSVGQEYLVRNIERAVKALEGPQTTLDISIHEKTHDIMVKVLNKETGELIREIPKEQTLDLVAKMMEIAGILVDKKI